MDAVNNIIGIFDAYSNGGDYARHYSETFSQFKNNNYGVSIYRYKDYIPDLEAVHMPAGHIDSVKGSDGRFTIKGWAYDPDDTKTSITVLVYLGGREGDSNAKSFTVTANKARSDVNKAKGITGNHGFEVTLTTDKTGLQPVYAYGVNIKEGKNAIIGESKVTVYEKMNGYLVGDVPKDAWYHDTVKECYETGLISGTSATTFSPNQNITRGMIVTVLWRMQGQPKVAFNSKFNDVKSNQWYSIPVSWAVKTGVVHGYGDGTFKPDGAVTREQVAVMLANYAQYKKVYKASSSSSLSWYSDYSEISSWAVPAMSWAVSNDIIYGSYWGFYPKDSATRAQGAAMILRFNNLL